MCQCRLGSDRSGGFPRVVTSTVSLWTRTQNLQSVGNIIRGGHVPISHYSAYEIDNSDNIDTFDNSDNFKKSEEPRTSVWFD